jgi:transposase-like protein
MNITDPIYSDEDKAREHFERVQWPDGPICPHCGVVNEATKLEGKSTRPGVYKCRPCGKPFSVTVGTVFERSHIPLNKWLYAMHVLASGKKGTSAHQLHRELGISYPSAWFMCHRIREAIRPAKYPVKLGGDDEIVEVDETFVGGKLKNRKSRKVKPKRAVVALVERGGDVRTFPIKRVNSRNMNAILRKQVSKKSYLMTDDSTIYPKIGKTFARHSAVNHSIEEYVRGGAHVNTAENYFSIFKRGIYGIYHHISEKHMPLYLAEFDFRYNNRMKLGVDDTERAEKILRGARGKRLTLRRPDEKAQASPQA